MSAADELPWSLCGEPVCPLHPMHLPGVHPQLPGFSLVLPAFFGPHPGHAAEKQELVWPQRLEC